MNVHRIKTIVTKDGKLTLENLPDHLLVRVPFEPIAMSEN